MIAREKEEATGRGERRRGRGGGGLSEGGWGVGRGWGGGDMINKGVGVRANEETVTTEIGAEGRDTKRQRK